MKSLNDIGNALLNIRYELDPLDDAFHSLGRYDKAFPCLTEDFVSQCLSKCESIDENLSLFTEHDKNIDYFIIKQQVDELTHKLHMRLWGTFLVGYDHSPLGRVTGLIPAMKIETDVDKIYLLKILNSVQGYLDSCGSELIRAYTNHREPLMSNVSSAIERWSNIIENNGMDLLPEKIEESLRIVCLEVFTISIEPAIKRYVDILYSIINNCRADTNPGMCNIHDGRQQYIELVKFNTDNFSSPDEVHRFGLQEVARIQRKIQHLRTDGSTADDGFFSRELLIKTGTEEIYRNENEFFNDFNDIIQRIDVMFGEVFDFSTILPLNIKKIPAHLAESSPTAYYVPGTDNSHPGTLFINPVSMIGETKGSADAMIYHETLPGHHVQFELARQLVLPDYRKTAWFNCFIEGWALYVEDLAEELGLYHSSEQQKGKLSQELFRAARLVVDTGLHLLGWSKSKAINYLLDNTGLTQKQAVREIERYIEYPAQALSYATGKYHIQALRQRCISIQKNAFDLKKFHNCVLKHGVAPVYAIEFNVMSELCAHRA